MDTSPDNPDTSGNRAAAAGKVDPAHWDFVFRLLRERPDECAKVVLTRAQQVVLLLFAIGVAASLWKCALLSLTVINGLLISFYLVLCTFKLYLIHLSLGRPVEMRFSPAEVAALRDDELPPYSILVPLYREAESLPRLLKALRDLDYPEEKLDVQFLLEEDDAPTIEAVQALELPKFIRVVITPDAPPKTKPKACNLGLAQARGDYLVIYDAEDRPDPAQLKKAVLGFRHTPADVICLQAKLNYYNQRQNLLTRLFTCEYSMWFDLFLPGLARLDAPIPLGGTSNHFVVSALRELRGWDPYNVTEDADLGARLAAKGMTTRIIDSTTWEEACSDLGFWIRQRSRWTKGYIQTYLVQMRHPVRLLRHLGIGRWLSFQLMVGGTPLCLLINPVYWLLTVLWFALRWEHLNVLVPFPIILWGLVCLFAGNFAFVYASMLAAYRRGYYDLVKYAVLVPAYWLLMSVGAWKGFLQLITRPNYWEKTKHGLDLAAGFPETVQTPALPPSGTDDARRDAVPKASEGTP